MTTLVGDDHDPDPTLGSPADTTSSRSTLAIIAISACVAVVGWVLTSGVGVGFMAFLFRGDEEVDGAGVSALLWLGFGAAVLVTLALYLGTGFRMIRQHRGQGQRIRPGLMLLSVPVLAVALVVLFNR